MPRLGQQHKHSYNHIGVTNIPGQQAALTGCLHINIEKYLYSVIGDKKHSFGGNAGVVEALTTRLKNSRWQQMWNAGTAGKQVI